jgi:hypothetical protein
VPDQYPDERDSLRDLYRRPQEECYGIAGADWRGFQDFVELITGALRSVLSGRALKQQRLKSYIAQGRLVDYLCEDDMAP